MSRKPATLLTLLLGTVLGFALATTTGVMALRKPEAGDLPWRDARLMAEVIERVKEEYVDPVDDHELMQHAIRGMVANLDAHSAFLEEDELADLMVASEGNYTGIGIEVSYEDGAIVVVAPIEGTPAERAGLRTGDRIVAIDGQAVKQAGLGGSVGRMRGEPGTLVRVEVERDGAAEPIEYTITRARIDVHSVRQAMLEPGYGYVRIAQFSETTIDDLEAGVGQLLERAGGSLAGVVLDLRSNPGGVLDAGVDVADAFLERGLIVSATGRGPDARFSVEAEPGDLIDGARLVVLVNGGSASASEIVAGALHDHGRATLLGRTTFGKGSVQTILPLSDGRAIKLTTSRYFTPAGLSIHERGIEPDIELPATGEAVTYGELAADPELRTALDWLKSAAPRVAGAGAEPSAT